MNASLATFSWALVTGIVLILISRKLGLTAIVTLLIGGVVLGPYGLNIIIPESLGRDGLKTIVSVAIGLILFEGGLTLRVGDYRKTSAEIKLLLTCGVIITWWMSALLIWLFYPRFGWQYCLLAASLIIVTGPTVIGPLLKRIRVKKSLGTILCWEGILIDPIGVFIALLCYEWISAGGSQAANHFALRIIVGVTIGLAGGWGLSLIVRKSWVVQEHVNSFIIAAAIAIFVLSDQLSHESGLLSVIVAGFVMSYLDHGQLDQVRAYKEQITEMLIGLLFILLAANLNISAFQQYGWRLPLLIVTIMVVVRPLNIFVSTWKSQLSLADKLFLSWVAPRGIVAASMASLFALSLNSSGDHVQAQFLEIFTYSVIIGTVILQASSAGLVGKILGILAPSPKGWLIIGACKLGRTIAKFIQHKNVPVVIIDSNLHLIRLARKDGLTAIHDNAQLFRLEEQPELYNFSAVLAMTSNDAYNTICCQHWQKELPLAKCYEWSHPDLRGEVNMICAGQPVWQHLALRKVVNSEHDLEISIRHVDAKDCPHPLRVLMCYFQETFYPYLPKEASGQLDILEYHGDPGLEFKLKPEWILFTKAKTSSEAVEQIFKKMIIDIPQLPVERLIASFSRQELDQHELLAYDIALFHTYSHHIQTCAVAIARLQKPIMVMEEEVDIIFVILSPEGQPQKHLETLARIGRFILNEENRKQMREALTPEQMLALFY